MLSVIAGFRRPGKELKALMKKQLEGEKEDGEMEEGQDESFSSPEKVIFQKWESKGVSSLDQGEAYPRP